MGFFWKVITALLLLRESWIFQKEEKSERAMEHGGGAGRFQDSRAVVILQGGVGGDGCSLQTREPVQ